MIVLTHEQLRMVARVSHQHPEFREFVDAWRREELETMAVCADHHFGTLKGRVQLLTDLQQLLRLSNP